MEWCGVQLPGPCGPLGISTMKLRFLHGGRGPDLSYLPSASLQRDCWGAGEKEESRAGGGRGEGRGGRGRGGGEVKEEEDGRRGCKTFTVCVPVVSAEIKLLKGFFFFFF